MQSTDHSSEKRRCHDLAHGRAPCRNGRRPPSLAACAGGSSSQQAAGPRRPSRVRQPSGFVEMHEVQVAYIGNAGGGSGTLTYDGKTTRSARSPGSASAVIGVADCRRRGRVYDLKAWPLRRRPGAGPAAVAVTASATSARSKNESS